MKEQIHLYIEKDLKDRVEAFAKKDRRYVNSAVCLMIEWFLNTMIPPYQGEKKSRGKIEAGTMLFGKEKEDGHRKR